MQDHHEEIERLRAAVDELKLLNEIALEATAAASVEEILGMIIDKSLKVVNAEQGSILLVSDESNASLKTFIRQDNRSSLRNSYRVGVHITGYVLYHREPLRIDDLAHDPRFEPDEQEQAEIHSVLCVPIINQGHLIGAFMMTNKKRSPFVLQPFLPEQNASGGNCTGKQKSLMGVGTWACFPTLPTGEAPER